MKEKSNRAGGKGSRARKSPQVRKPRASARGLVLALINKNTGRVFARVKLPGDPDAWQHALERAAKLTGKTFEQFLIDAVAAGIEALDNAPNPPQPLKTGGAR